MKKVTVVYRIVTYILVVFACLLGFGCFLMLFAIFSNPGALISVAAVGAVVAYSFTSFYFSLRCVEYNRPCKPSMQVWIRVTAIITVMFAIYNLTIIIYLLANPNIMDDYVKDMFKQPAFKSSSVNKDDLLKSLRGVMYVCEAYFLLLMLHVTITFGLLKQYKHLFRKDDGNAPKPKDELL